MECSVLFSFHNSLSLPLLRFQNPLFPTLPQNPNHIPCLLGSPQASLSAHMGRCAFHPAATLTTALAFLLFSSSFSSSQHPDGQSGTNHKVLIEFSDGQRKILSLTEEFERVARTLIGPGSSPPSCRSRCGRCAPCRAVHVPIQPGLNKPLEYYPEAWRCKCGNSLFMP